MGDILAEISALSVSTVISSHDRMFAAANERHYYYVGKSDILTIRNVLNIRKSYPNGASPILDILDFGCGHGRVTRWLRAAFPGTQLHVTDFDTTGVAFCMESFDCLDTKGNLPEAAFDLIWLGSVFTHLPQQIVEVLLTRLTNALRANGVLVFTSQGRFPVGNLRSFNWENEEPSWLRYGLSREAVDKVLKGYDAEGYGYVDYPGQQDYGVCVARPEWYSAYLLRHNHLTQILFQEKGSDNHQDVSAYMRTDVMNREKGPLW